MFADEYNIPYSLLRKKSIGWIDDKGIIKEQKGTKNENTPPDNQLKTEIDMNQAHFEAAEKLISVMMKTMDVESLTKSPKSIATLAKALKDAQAVQRIAIGADKTTKVSAIEEFIKAVQDESDSDAD